MAVRTTLSDGSFVEVTQVPPGPYPQYQPGGYQVQRYTAGGDAVGEPFSFITSGAQPPIITPTTDAGWVGVFPSRYYHTGARVVLGEANGIVTDVQRSVSPPTTDYTVTATAIADGGFALVYKGGGFETSFEEFDTLGASVRGAKIDGHISQITAGPGDGCTLTWHTSGNVTKTFVIDPDSPPDLTPPTGVRIVGVDDVPAITGEFGSGTPTNDPTPSFRVTVRQAGDQIRGLSSNELYTVTEADVTRGYVEVHPIYSSFSYRVTEPSGVYSDLAFFYSVDTSAPGAPSIIAVFDNVGAQQGEVPGGGRTDDNQLRVDVGLSGTSAQAGDTLQVFVDGQLLSTRTLAAGDIGAGYWSFVTPPLADGAHSFTSSLMDRAGNASPVGPARHVDVQTGATQPGNPAAGQVLTADQPGDSLAGGTGNDTLIASQGPDQLTGGAGGDHFVYKALPWSAGKVTDFTDGADRIDLTALYQASGYTGADALADSYVRFESDGAGGTKVMYDTDGAASGQAWAYHITTLQGVAPSALSNADLVGGSSGQPQDTQPAISSNTPTGDSTLLFQMNEENLLGGASPNAEALTKTGSIYLKAPDGVRDFSISTATVISNGVFTPGSFDWGFGTGLVTAYDAASGRLDISFTMTRTYNHTANSPPFADAPSAATSASGLILKDTDGDVANGMFAVRVLDSLPSARADTDNVGAGGTATGNVLTDAAPGDQGDTDSGADRLGPDVAKLVAVVAETNGSPSDRLDAGETQMQVRGKHGVLTLQANGDYAYVADSSAPAGATETFTYSLDDPDSVTARPDHFGQLTITIGSGGEPTTGQVLRADQAGDTLAGGAGTDTLYASQGPDQLTGGGGADHYAFEALPWRAGVITDFADGSDKVDLRALLQASGYTGADAVADRYVSFESDGAGGTKVMFDTDGAGSGQAWSYHITTLQGVAASSLSNADLVGGSTGGEQTQPGGGETSSGQVLTADQPGDTLAGGAGNDTLNASQGPDQLTGAGGVDRFVFGKAPWNAGVITDFAPGSDKIDVSALLDAYAGSNPIADGWLRLDEAGGSTKVYVDIDGAGGEWPFLITTLQGVAPSGVSLSDFVL